MFGALVNTMKPLIEILLKLFENHNVLKAIDINLRNDRVPHQIKHYETTKESRSFYLSTKFEVKQTNLKN